MNEETKKKSLYHPSYKKYHYSVLTTQMMDYLHTTTIKMLKIIVSIFDRENIRYSICGGTLRGAFLLGKYLPWDEDIDLCVYEEDYDRMVKTLLMSIPDWMVVQCKATEPNYYHGWIKIRDRKSHIYPDESIYTYNGVLIDIYKLTKVKESEIDYAIAKEHLDYLNRRYLVGGITEEEKEKRIRKNNLYERVESSLCLERVTDEDYKYIVWSNVKVFLDEDRCFPMQKMSFEGVSISCFRDPKHYLLRHYGVDYMILPSEKDRFVEINHIEI